MTSNAEGSAYSIGHSNHRIEVFLGLLERHGITAVADVRSHPFSRYNPQFRKRELARSLGSTGIAYVFLGRELGARTQDRSCYVDGRVDFERLARTELFRSGIERVLQEMHEHRIALLCAEKEPLDCHRTILVSRALVDRGIAVQHILVDGSLESHPAALRRLMAAVGMQRAELFRSPEERVVEAYRRRGQQIAYQA